MRGWSNIQKRRLRVLIGLLCLMAAPALAQSPAATSPRPFSFPVPVATSPSRPQNPVPRFPVPVPVPSAVLTAAQQQQAAQAQIQQLDIQIAKLQQDLQAALLQPHTPAAAVPFGQSYTNTTGRLAVAHYQASCRAWGNGSVSGCLAEISKARAMGFDAFSIDLNAYTGPYPYNVDNLYIAANQGNAINKGAVNDKGVGDFKLFITLDFSTFPYNQADVLPVLTKYLKDPANLIYNGKAVYSTYTGGGNRTQAVLKAFWVGVNSSLAAQGITPCFIPGFETTDAAGNGLADTPANCAAYAAFLKTFADGWWQFPNTDTPFQPYDSGLPGDEARAAAARAAGLIVMTGQVGGFWGSAHSQGRDGTVRFYNEYYGGEGLAAYWRSINKVQNVDIVQYVGWNDYDEASNIDDHDVGPGSEWPYLYHSSVPGFYLPKAGLVNEFQLGLQEFKTGQPPKFTRIDANVFYRPQIAAVALNTTTGGALIDALGPIARLNDESGGGNITGGGGILDIACLTISAPKALTFVWSVGTVYIKRLVPAGVSYVRVPMMAGQPSLALTAPDGATLTVPGLMPIADHADYLNCNIFSQAAHN